MPELAPWGAKLDAKPTPCPSPRLFVQSLACCPRSVYFFLPTCLPCSGCCANHLAVRLLCCSQIIALKYLGTLSLCLSSFRHLLLTLFPSSRLLHLLSAMPKKKSPEDFFQRAREKGSNINKAIVNGTAGNKHIEPKTEKNYARALGLWNG